MPESLHLQPPEPLTWESWWRGPEAGDARPLPSRYEVGKNVVPADIIIVTFGGPGGSSFAHVLDPDAYPDGWCVNGHGPFPVSQRSVELDEHRKPLRCHEEPCEREMEINLRRWCG